MIIKSHNNNQYTIDAICVQINFNNGVQILFKNSHKLYNLKNFKHRKHKK